MRFLKTIFSFFLIFFFGLVVLGLILPKSNEFKVCKQLEISENCAIEYMSDLQKFSQWSPWEKLDPNMTKSYDGIMGELNSSMTWSGNVKVGKGKMTLIEKSNQHVLFSLEFAGYPPTKSKMYLNKVEGKNEICWTMDYSTPKELYLKPFSGIMYTMMNFFITQDYQNGLDALNKISCP